MKQHKTWWEALLEVASELGDTLTAVRVGAVVFKLPQQEEEARKAIGPAGPTGYGLPPEVAVIGYGRDFFYVTGVYDGATWIEPVPREYTPGEAEFVGGW